MLRRVTWTILICCALALCSCDEEKSGSGKGGSGGGGPGTPPIILTTYLGHTFVGELYNVCVHAAAGSPSYNWSLSQGTLPPGLSLQSTTSQSAVISGSPTAAGTYPFTLQLSDGSASVEQALSIHVGATVFYTRVVFVCDMSSATAGSPNTKMRDELTQIVNELTQYEEFDIVVYNDTLAGGYTALWGTLLPGTTANVATALAWINSSNLDPAGNVGSTMYDAWEFAYQYSNLTKTFFMVHDEAGNGTNILSDLQAWDAQQSDCEIVVMVVDANAATQSFGQDAAAALGGSYVPL